MIKVNYTKSQQEALNILRSGENVFLTGDAGTGKSFLINNYIQEISENKNVIVTAPTGIAALNIGGVTMHRAFKMPTHPIVDALEHRKCVKSLKKCDVLIIDEISMVRIDYFEYVMKMVLNSKKQMQIVLVGDFYQLPPVITDNIREILERVYVELGNGYAFQSVLWRIMKFQTVQLKEVVRQKDVDFMNNLNRLRIGDDSCIDYFNKRTSEPDDNAVTLFFSNKEVARFNEQMLKKISKRKKKTTYYSRTDGIVSSGDKPTEEQLTLVNGCRVMFVVNDCDGNQYQNGTLGTVVGMKEESVTVKTDDGKTVVVSPYQWMVEEYDTKVVEGEVILVKNVIGSYVQIPLKIAYAITVHKSQGQSFKAVNVSVSNKYSRDGLLYVALSRAIDINKLNILTKINKKQLASNSSVVDFYKGEL